MTSGSFLFAESVRLGIPRAKDQNGNIIGSGTSETGLVSKTFQVYGHGLSALGDEGASLIFGSYINWFFKDNGQNPQRIASYYIGINVGTFGVNGNYRPGVIEQDVLVFHAFTSNQGKVGATARLEATATSFYYPPQPEYQWGIYWEDDYSFVEVENHSYERLNVYFDGIVEPPPQPGALCKISPLEKVHPAIPPSGVKSFNCEACGAMAPGSVSAKLGSIHVTFGMGKDSQSSYDTPIIFIESPQLTRQLFTAAALSVNGRVQRVEYPTGSGTDLQYLSENTVVQVLENTNRLDLHFYERSQLIALNSNGSYPLTSEIPHTRISIENITPTNTIPTLQVTKQVGTSEDTWIYSWSSVVNGLSLTHHDDTTMLSESLFTVAEDLANQTRVETRTVYSNSQELSKTETVIQMLDHGEEIVSETSDPDSATPKVSNWKYYADTVVPGRYGKLQSEQTTDGDWHFYTYDEHGRLAKHYSRYLDDADLPLSGEPSELTSRLVEHIYTDSVSGPSPSPRTVAIVEKIRGLEISRKYRIAYQDGFDEAVCLQPGAAWNAPENLVTKYRYYYTGPHSGKPSRTSFPDGTVTLYNYSMEAANGTTTTNQSQAVVWQSVITTGQINPGGTAIIAGTRIISRTNRQGYEVEARTEDVATNTVIQHSEAITIDGFGRPTEVENVLSGKTTQTVYGCCGVVATRDSNGVVTTHSDNGLTHSETTLGITTSTTRSGRTTIVTRTGTDNTTLELRRSTINMAGVVTTSHSREGGLIIETRDSVGAFKRHTTTAEDGGTRITLSYPDGKIKSITGTAIYPTAYEEGVESTLNEGATIHSRWSKETALDSNGNVTQEWSKSWTDMAGRVWKIENSAGSISHQYYNSFGQLEKAVDPDNVTTLYAYDAQGQLVVTAIDMDRNGVINFNGTDRITRTAKTYTVRAGIAVERTSVEVWETDNSGTPTNIRTIERAVDGLQNWFTEGSLTTEQILAPGPNGWDGNWTATTIYPDHSSFVQTYASGRLSSEVRRDSTSAIVERRDLTYDAHGRLWKITDGRGATTVQSYEQTANPFSGGHPFSADLVKTVQSPPQVPNGAASALTYDYDSLGRMNKVTDSLNGSVETTYYPTGRIKSRSGNRTHPVSFTYTPQGRIETMTTNTDAGPSVTSWIYYPISGLLHQKKLNGVAIYARSYKASGLLSTSTSARGITTSFDYSPAGEQSSINYSDNTPDVSLTYSRLGHLKTATNGILTDTLYTNAYGQLQTESWAGGFHEGVLLTHSFDSLRRQDGLIVMQSANPLASYNMGYDQASRVKSVSTENLSATYSYIAQSDLPDSITFRRDNIKYAIADYEFYPTGHLKWIKYRDGTGMLHTGSTYEVSAIHRRTRVTREDGSHWDWGYNERGEIESASRKFADTTEVPLDQYSYTYDDIGNRLTSVIAGRGTTYQPNLLNQYPARTNPGYAFTTGDAPVDANIAINNEIPARKGALFWKELPANNNSAGVYLPVDVYAAKRGAGTGGEDLVARQKGALYVPPASQTLIYDADGNLQADGRWIYTWDGANRLSAMEEQVSASLNAASLQRQRLEFTYDPFGRRATKKVSAWNPTTSSWDVRKRSVFIWNGWNLVADLEGAETNIPSLKHSYIWGLDVTGSLKSSGGVGSLLFEFINSVRSTPTYDSQGQITSETHALYHSWNTPTYDGNGNVIGLIATESGALSATYEYSPFGALLRASGLLALENPIQFSTKYNDAETELLYYGYRYYSPSLGSWLSRDPLEEAGGGNAYGFVSNSPVSYIDRLGLFAEAGHFWSSYGLMTAAGLSPVSAFGNAYYAQLPDEVPWLDAYSLWLYTNNEAVQTGMGLAGHKLSSTDKGAITTALAGLNVDAWARDVMEVIHSLHGGGEAEVIARQCCLVNILRSGSLGGARLTEWERGFIIHALGDSYAHTKIKDDGISYDSAYGYPNGHGFDSATGKDPDLIGNRMLPYLSFGRALSAAFATPSANHAIRDSVLTFGASLKPFGHTSNNYAFFTFIVSNPEFGWAQLPLSMQGYDPNTHFSTLPGMFVPTPGDVQDLMNRIRRECPKP